jgi:hypothetical protein
MTVSDVTGVIRDHVAAFAIAIAFVVILCTVVRHEYPKKGLRLMFAWLLLSVVLSALGAWIDQTWGRWPARIYSAILNAAVVTAIVIWMKRERATERERSSEHTTASNRK